MRSSWCLLVVLAACGPKRSGPAKDYTLHDKLVVRVGTDEHALAYQMMDPEDGALTPIYAQVTAEDTLWDAKWAGRCVVYAHGAGFVDVFDPVTSKGWTLDEGNGGVQLAVSEDGLRVAWDCTGEAGPSICVTLVENTEDNAEIAVSPDGEQPIFPLGWIGDEVLYGDGHTLWATSYRGGAARELAKIESEGVIFAPGGRTFVYPDGDAFAVHDGLTGAASRRIETGEPAKYRSCVYAGPDHLACWMASFSVQLFDLATGAATELTPPVDGDWVLGAPTGDGAAYTVGDKGEVWVVRGGTSPKKIAEGVFALDDWRP
jgi:hypothetical protein